MADLKDLPTDELVGMLRRYRHQAAVTRAAMDEIEAILAPRRALESARRKLQGAGLSQEEIDAIRGAAPAETPPADPVPPAAE